MEKWKNVRAEAKMNLKDGRVSLPREWTCKINGNCGFGHIC